MGMRMSDLATETTAPESAQLLVSRGLFAWRGGRIFLFGERTAGRWILARAWRDQDRLTDVRRWSFADPETFARQIGRLAREEIGAGAVADLPAAALAWAVAEGGVLDPA